MCIRDRHTGAQRPIFVGDRIDTDIMGANRAGMPSLLVFTGAHGKRDLLEAAAGDRPSFIGADLSALLAPPRAAAQQGHSWHCGDAVAELVEGVASVQGQLSTHSGQLDALWALANLVWATDADATDALARLDQLHRAWLDRYGLTEVAEHSIYDLSGGERQLAALVSVLAVEPSVLVCDEPTTLLDLRNRNLVAGVLDALPHQVILATHDLDLAARAERVVLIAEGRVAADGSPSEVIGTYRRSMA